MGDGHDHGVGRARGVRRRDPRLGMGVDEPCDHGLGDACHLAFGREEGLGDGPEDLCAIAGFPCVEFVPDLFVDVPTDLFEFRKGVGSGGRGKGRGD